MEETVYQVKTENFEGPLDVLLSLIEKKKMHISDVSLSDVTDDYIQYIQGNMGHDLPNVTLFLSIAATLVYMKSKMLLDDGSLQDEEMNVAGHNLEERLRLLESLRNGTSKYVNGMVSPFVSLLKKKQINTVSFQPHEKITKEYLFDLAITLIKSLPEEKENLPKVAIMRVMSLEDMLYKITGTLRNVRSKVSFNDLAQSVQFNGMEIRERKVSLIISFLAVLELMRSGLIDIEQVSTYGDIMCEPMKTVAMNPSAI